MVDRACIVVALALNKIPSFEDVVRFGVSSVLHVVVVVVVVVVVAVPALSPLALLCARCWLLGARRQSLNLFQRLDSFVCSNHPSPDVLGFVVSIPHLLPPFVVVLVAVGLSAMSTSCRCYKDNGFAHRIFA